MCEGICTPVLASIFIAVAFVGLPIATHAANNLPCDNPHTATAADIAAGYPEGSLVCPNDYQQSGVTPQSGEAKQYLRSILCSPDKDNYGGKGPDGTIQGLDAQFSVCAAKLLKSARASGINVCVREGARSVEKQNEYVRRGIIACKKGARCEHPRGIAIDVNVFPNPTTCPSYKRLHDSAASFGVTFYLGCKDAFHFVPKKDSSCSGGGVIQPDEFYDYPQYYEQPSAPSSRISDFIRGVFGEPMNSTTCFTSIEPPSIAPAGTVPQSQCIVDNQGQNFPPPPPPPPPPKQSSQTSPPMGGSSGGGQQSGQNTSSGGSAPAGTNNPDPGYTSDIDSPPVSDYIINRVESVGTTGPMLNPDTSDIAMLSPTTSPRTIYATGSIAFAQPGGSLQTFTSGDLASDTLRGFVGQQQEQGFVFQILESMRNTLLNALSYLRPFGRSEPVTPI